MFVLVLCHSGAALLQHSCAANCQRFSLLVSSDGPLTDGGALVTGHLQCQPTLHTLMRFPLVVLVMLSPLRMLPL